MFATLRSALRTLANLSDAVASLQRRVAVLETAETVRSAEHHAMIDQLDRLYKRLVVRIARAPRVDPPDESVLALRERLSRGKNGL